MSIINHIHYQLEQQNQIVYIRPRLMQDSPRHKKTARLFNFLVRMFERNNVRPRANNTLSNKFTNRMPSFFEEHYLGNESEPIPKSKKSEKIGNETEPPSRQRSKLKIVWVNFQRYCEKSSLHGLRYIGDITTSFGERLFWLLSFLCAVTFATYFINNIYVKYNTSPVIITLNPEPTSILSIPFPAITICNMNQAKKSEAEAILLNGTDLDKRLLDDYCNSNNSFTNVTSDDTSEFNNVLKFMLKVGDSCQDLVKSCQWRREDFNCEMTLNLALTDEGLCCSFNRLPADYVFRNPKELGDLNITYPALVEDWSPERGFREDAILNATPWRPLGAGAHLGLSLVLDAGLEKYYCSSTSSAGFKVLMHNPLETPKMADFGFLISPGVEERVVIQPNINDASENIRDIDIYKRKCFFSNERYLKYYRTYTQRNCVLECQANYTLERCGCVPYFLPKSRFTKICGKKQEECSNRAKVKLETSSPNRSECDCLPGCFELSFSKSTSEGKLLNSFKIRDEHLRNIPIDYFVKNIAVVHFYFLRSSFTAYTKTELFGFSEFLSNTGGLLGLFLGFSFLSAIEIGYYLSLKICCSYVRTQRKKKIGRKKTELNNVYPFTK